MQPTDLPRDIYLDLTTPPPIIRSTPLTGQTLEAINKRLEKKRLLAIRRAREEGIIDEYSIALPDDED